MHVHVYGVYMYMYMVCVWQGHDETITTSDLLFCLYRQVVHRLFNLLRQSLALPVGLEQDLKDHFLPVMASHSHAGYTLQGWMCQCVCVCVCMSELIEP